MVRKWKTMLRSISAFLLLHPELFVYDNRRCHLLSGISGEWRINHQFWTCFRYRNSRNSGQNASDAIHTHTHNEPSAIDDMNSCINISNGNPNEMNDIANEKKIKTMHAPKYRREKSV